MKKTKIISFLLVFTVTISGCKDEKSSEVEALNIAKLWKWFGKYSDNILDFSKLKHTDSDDLKSLKHIDSLFPLTGLKSLKQIFSLNQTQYVRRAKVLKNIDGGKLALVDFPLKRLPGGLPSRFEKAFEVLRLSLAEKGRGKIASRRLASQLVEKLAKENNISFEKAYEMQLDAFVKATFKVPAKPLPNEFAGVNTFYGHLLREKAPFLDVAFGKNGVLGPDKAPEKATHGVFVHIEDFFEWEILCKVSDCGDATFSELLRFIARNGIAENASLLSNKLKTLAHGSPEFVAAGKELEESLSLLGISKMQLDHLKNGKEIFFTDNGIKTPFRLLDWGSNTAFNNGTSLWDVFFDFQNLSDDAFKNKEALRRAFGNPKEGFLAFSMNVAANPMYMGRSEILRTFFSKLGWH